MLRQRILDCARDGFKNTGRGCVLIKPAARDWALSYKPIRVATGGIVIGNSIFAWHVRTFDPSRETLCLFDSDGCKSLIWISR